MDSRSLSWGMRPPSSSFPIPWPPGRPRPETVPRPVHGLHRRSGGHLLALASLLAASACSPGQPGPAERAARRLPLEICHPAGLSEPILCGRLAVPENRSDPASRTIELQVLVIPALAADPASEPWIDLEGGPGDPATTGYLPAAYLGELSLYREARDVILVDQRGSGRSSSLHCPALDDPADPLMPRFHLPAVRACRDSLAAEADLSGYSTAESVEDLEAIRAWLGYEAWHVFGYSYGTLQAQQYARRYPERVRSLFLWGPVPPSFRRPGGYARDGQAALEGLARDCTADPACAAAFPAPLDDLRSVLARLETEPARWSWAAAPDPVTRTVTITRDMFAESLWAMLFSTEGAREVFLRIRRARDGDFGSFLSAALSDGRLNSRDAVEAMYLSVTCTEETLRIPDDEFTARVSEADATFLGSSRLRRQRAACLEWPRTSLPPGAVDPLVSDIPTVVVSGGLDPVTPPRWGRRIVDDLSDARLVVVPGMGHSSADGSGAECLDSLAVRLAATREVDGLPVDRCVAEIRQPGWAGLPQPAGGEGG